VVGLSPIVLSFSRSRLLISPQFCVSFYHVDVTGIALPDTPAPFSSLCSIYKHQVQRSIGWLVDLVHGAKHLHMAFTRSGGWRFFTAFCMYQKATGATKYHKTSSSTLVSIWPWDAVLNGETGKVLNVMRWNSSASQRIGAQHRWNGVSASLDAPNLSRVFLALAASSPSPAP